MSFSGAPAPPSALPHGKRARRSALSLRLVVRAGEVAQQRIRDRRSLIGLDLIAVHRTAIGSRPCPATPLARARFASSHGDAECRKPRERDETRRIYEVLRYGRNDQRGERECRGTVSEFVGVIRRTESKRR